MPTSQQLARVITALRARGARPRQQGEQWIARCPAHEDAQASLSVADGRIGVVLRCHAGCSFPQVLTTLQIDAQELFFTDQERPKSRSPRRIVATYQYRDGAVKVRYQPKGFGWTRNGKAGLDGLRPNDLLYGEELLAANLTASVVIVEGEKGAAALRSLMAKEGNNVVVIAGAGGAGWRPTRRVVSLLQGRVVLLWPDADAPGWGWARHLSRSCADVARTVKVIIVSDVPSGFDAADWTGDWAALREHVYPPTAIPGDGTGEDDQRRFVSVARGDEDLRGATPLTRSVYWHLVVHVGSGIVRCSAIDLSTLAKALGSPGRPAQAANHCSRALGELVQRGLICWGEGWVYLRRANRFQALKGKQIEAARKFLSRAPLPDLIRRALSDDEPGLASFYSSSTLPSVERVSRYSSPQRDIDTSGAYGHRSPVNPTGSQGEALNESPWAHGPSARDAWITDQITEVTTKPPGPASSGWDGPSDEPTACPHCGRDSCEGCDDLESGKEALP